MAPEIVEAREPTIKAMAEIETAFGKAIGIVADTADIKAVKKKNAA